MSGTAKPVNAGEHVFTFEIAGRGPVKRTLVITEGEKNRRELVTLEPAGPHAGAQAAEPPASAPAAPPTVTSPEPAASAHGGLGTQRALGLVAGAAGVAGLAVGGVFGVMTLSKKSDQDNACGAPCPATNHEQATNDHSAAVTDGTVSTVAFIAGGALLVGGVVLFLTGGHEAEAPATATFFVPTVGPGGGGLSWQGSF